MFDKFWSLYPRKTGKRKAELKYQQLVKDHSHEEIYEGLRRYMNYRYIVKKYVSKEGVIKGEGRTYIPHPATWLHQGRRNDELEMPSRKKQEPSKEMEQEIASMQSKSTGKYTDILRSLYS